VAALAVLDTEIAEYAENGERALNWSPSGSSAISAVNFAVDVA
jgi:hypothetical protein